MRTIILLNGEPYAGEIDAEGARVICCDGAYSWAKGRVKIDELIGDFDSLSNLPEGLAITRYPAEKDMTDGELSIERSLDMGATEIVIYGGGGLREDHFLGNLHLLCKAQRAGVRAELVTNFSRIFCAEGRVELNGLKGKTFSIIPFGGEAHILESGGFQYPLPERFVYGSTRGISNVILEENAHFTVRGAVLAIVNFD